MKLKVTTALIVSMVSANAATSVSLRNFFSASEGLPLVDNSGAVIPGAELTFEAGTISEADLLTIGGLDSTTDDAQVISFFTPATSATGTPGSANFAGLFNGSSDADDGGALGTATSPLFILVSRTEGGSVTDVLLFNAGQAFPVQNAGNAAAGLEVRDASDVVFGGGVVPVQDDSALPVPLQGGFGSGLSFNSAIPEPSTSLLAALAGLGLVARRRR